MNQELLEQLIVYIGQEIEKLGKDLQKYKFEGLTTRTADLVKLREGLLALIEMRRI